MKALQKRIYILELEALVSSWFCGVGVGGVDGSPQARRNFPSACPHYTDQSGKQKEEQSGEVSDKKAKMEGDDQRQKQQLCVLCCP